MLPTYVPGTRFEVELLYNRSELGVGELALVVLTSRAILHRVVATNPLLVKGDALTSADPPIPESALVARVIGTRS